MNDKFAVFILTHGRPHNVITYKTLRRQGYTGEIYLIIDNEDTTADEYYKEYGRDNVIMFDKAKIAETFDEMSTFNVGRKSVVYARNACFEIARNLGIRYFLELDDDYSRIDYRFDHELKFAWNIPKNLDALFEATLNYFKTIPALTIAYGQGGDFIGGGRGTWANKLTLKRKVMNSFFCDTERPFQFVGILNDDVNTYMRLNQQGRLVFTVFNATVLQKETQSNPGGLTDIYLQLGTYVKSFYTVMLAPSCVKVATTGDTHHRIHHITNWSSACPVIIGEQHRKT